MKDWNILVTTPPGQEHELLPVLNRLGHFTRSDFHGLLVGRVEEVPRFLEGIRLAGDEQAEWRHNLLRVLPVERTFPFTPQTFEERVREAVTPLVQRMTGGHLSRASGASRAQRHDPEPRRGTEPGRICAGAGNATGQSAARVIPGLGLYRHGGNCGKPVRGCLDHPGVAHTVSLREDPIEQRPDRRVRSQGDPSSESAVSP